MDERDTHQNTPLHHACLAGNLPVVEGLLSYGADVNAVNLHGKSCLQFGIFVSFVLKMRLFLCVFFFYKKI